MRVGGTRTGHCVAGMTAGRGRLELFAEWLARFGEAWERRDPDAVAACFVLEATFQPGPFDHLVRGRRAIASAWAERVAGEEGVAFRAQVLGAGDTYGIAHYRVSWRAPDVDDGAAGGGEEERVEDGILVVALDARGRCTALRRWAADSYRADPWGAGGP